MPRNEVITNPDHPRYNPALDPTPKADRPTRERANGDAQGQGKPSNPKDLVGMTKPIDAELNYATIGDVNSSAKGSGARFNDGKPDYSLLPLVTLEDEIRVWEYGKRKYAAWNWAKGMVWTVPFSCLMRHMAAWQAGQECDPESGLPHLAHASCNLRMLTLYAKTYIEGDDREKHWLKLFHETRVLPS